MTQRLAPDPARDSLPREAPSYPLPRAPETDITASWMGHASVLFQVGGLNILADPVWSERASPIAWAGPRRFTSPPVALEALPPIDVVVISHGHYDHLDGRTVDALHERHGAGLVWLTPPGYRSWFRARGVRGVVELGWWRSASVRLDSGVVRAHALPSRHWSQRQAFGREHRLWASWAFTTPAGRAVYYGGDSGYFAGFGEIGRALGPFDLAALPVGAYEPRWFMAAAHMNPEEAVQAYLDLGGVGACLGIHWGTFRLTDEDPLEPPVRTRSAWAAAGLDPRLLHLGPVGATVHCDGRARTDR